MILEIEKEDLYWF